MKHYHLSAKGRRTTLVLLISALAIWGFALWSFSSTLELGSNPLGFWSALNTGTEEGIEMSRLVPAFLMLVLIVATPLLMWNLLEEWAAAYTPTDEGLRFTSLGVHILYPWESIQDIRRLDDDSDEPVEELLLSTDETSQIRNPVLRFLHAQAYGRTRLPLYAGLEEREALLAEIRQRAGLTPAVDEAQPAAS
jgi:hypothetical protein